MKPVRLAALAALAAATLTLVGLQAQPSLAFGPDSECATLGDCQGITCTTNTGAFTGDTAVIFGHGGGGVAAACGDGTGPNLAVTSVNNGGLGFALAAQQLTTSTGGGIARASADGPGSLAGASAFNGTVGVSTTAGATGLAIGSAVTDEPTGSFSNGAFGLSAFGGETIAAPNVAVLPGQTDCVSVGNAIASTFSNDFGTSSLCVGNHVVVAGQ